jgi:hypothetical protein
MPQPDPASRSTSSDGLENFPLAIGQSPRRTLKMELFPLPFGPFKKRYARFKFYQNRLPSSKWENILK